MELSEVDYSLLSSPYDSFMRKHLQHYGYFTGRAEIIKKYGFLPSKSELLSSSGDSESSSSEEEQEKLRPRPFISDVKLPLRQARIPFGLNPRGASNDDSSFEPRWPIEIEVLNEPRIRHINVPPIHPELFYKPTTDHGPYVRSFDENNGRTVFNYNPETCGYFVRSRIGGNREGCRSAAVPLQGDVDTTVLFESRFESGNLMKAVQVGEFDYELYLRYDLYTKRNTQWYYFRLQNVQVDQRYRFTIVNFFKSTSLYSAGMRPLMYSVQDAETKGIGWRRWGEEIVYYKNNLLAPDNATNMYSLTWTCKFPNNNDTYYFAHCYPYTYSDLQDYLNEIQNDRSKSDYCKQKVLCRTLAGNFIYMLTITNPVPLQTNPTNTSTPSEHQVKKGVVVTARVHPGETNGSWMMKGLLDFLLGDSADAKLLRDNFIFKIIPMLNPDGVIVGNYRCSLAGRDLNRNYKTVLKDAYPSIWHTREMIKRFMTETELVLYCDFHGHSRKQNVFVYGCENKHLPNERLKERIFPAMLAKNDPSKFSYDSCKFKVQKAKEGTGRIVMWSMGVMNSYTLEATFCGSTQGDRVGQHFTTKDLESIGYHFLDSLLDYCDPDETKRNRMLHELEDNLRQSIQMKLLARGINPSSLGDIDLDQFSSDGDSSDDDGSDSSADDGLPKHLEVIAAAKLRLKKSGKKVTPTKPIKEIKKKDEIDKESSAKTKSTGLPVPKPRASQFPNIDLLETTNNLSSIQETEGDTTQRKRRRKRGYQNYRVCKCVACLNARLPRTEIPLITEVVKPRTAMSARRLHTCNTEPVRLEGSSSTAAMPRSTRCPTLTPTSIPSNRVATADEKARRSQQIFKANHGDPVRYSACQTADLHELTLINESRNAFTTTYLLRRLNNPERDSLNGTNVSPTTQPPRIPSSFADEDASYPLTTDNETDLDRSRTTVLTHNDDTGQISSAFVTNRVSSQLQERLIGSSRRSRSTTSFLQNRSPVDAPAPNPKRFTDLQQQQKQRATLLFNRQDERRSRDSLNNDDNLSSVSKQIPFQVDEMSLNRPQLTRSSSVKKSSK
ncbi:unnamed protein product [Adineta ricciae]|uniref:Peptidase M14 domain-containing protein n=2 Tax=Adineta ricciae TaxID=249248 RepID=A0A813XBG2_ADIRI|nr:unnamed protein product [Adineta ricciae]